MLRSVVLENLKNTNLSKEEQLVVQEILLNPPNEFIKKIPLLNTQKSKQAAIELHFRYRYLWY